MPKSDGYKNLISGKERSKEELRKNGAKGGKASGEARRKKKTLRETLNMLLDLSLKEGKKANMENIKSFAGLQGANVSVQDALLITQVQKALKGDARAFDAIKSIIMPTAEDEKTTQAQGSSNSVIIEIVGRENNGTNES